MKEFESHIRNEFQYLSYAPIVFVSAKTHQRLNELPKLIRRVDENHSKRVSSAVLNDVIMDAIAHNPTPTDNGKDCAFTMRHRLQSSRRRSSFSSMILN